MTNPNFIQELRWRGMLHDLMPDTEQYLLDHPSTVAYIGFDPTADSLHVGSLCQIMILVHFQRCGHTPIALVGGATGMIGDPSGKSTERNLLSIEDLQHNIEGIELQLKRFLDFTGDNAAQIVNNYDWFKDFKILDFLRDVGKHLPINYMLAKDSVQKRLETGLSFTEFSYQLLQGYDFYWLYKNKHVRLQMGGSDQWGNITAGTELIRRIAAGNAFAATCSLITKADGTKFGKSESGNIWLDAKQTSAYKFYQFWLNQTDQDAKRYIKIFTLLDQKQIEDIATQHDQAPHLRLIQKTLAQDVTCRVHSEQDYHKVLAASEILFGKGTNEELKSLDKQTLESIFEEIPCIRNPLTHQDLEEQTTDIVSFLVEKTNICASKREARELLQGGSISINKIKNTDANYMVSSKDLVCSAFMLIQKGKKNYYGVSI